MGNKDAVDDYVIRRYLDGWRSRWKKRGKYNYITARKGQSGRGLGACSLFW